MAAARMQTVVIIALALALQDKEVFAAKRVDVRKRMASMVEHFNSPTGKRSLNGLNPSAKQMLGLQSGENLLNMNSIKTVSGSVKTKYEETFQGVPVAGEGVVLETDNNGKWTGEATGQLVEGIEHDIQSVTPALNANDALRAALTYAGLDRSVVDFDENSDVTLQVTVKNKDANSQDVSAKLTYKLSFRTQTPEGLARPFYIIDASNGDLISSWEGITDFPVIEDFLGTELKGGESSSNAKPSASTGQAADNGYGTVYVTGDGGNVGRGRHIYGKDYGKLLVTKIGRRCYLKNDKVEVMEFSLCNYTKNREDTNRPHSFSCYEGNYDFANGGFSPSNDAYYYSWAGYNMYKQWYNTEPLKFKIKVKVHYANYANAFWDGKHVIFLDGGWRMFPLTEPGIVGHELSHGFTEHNSGLVYSSQSGGINEAFSDMAGETLEYYLDNKTDFLIGGKLAKYGGKPLRYMKDPTMDGRSLGTFDDYCDGIDVHYSSGIFNRAFYLLVNERGWSVRKAFHAFVIANKIYWRENSGFHDAACGVKNAAKDLGYNEDDIFQAFRKVGVIPCISGPNTEVGGIGSLKVVGKGALHFVWHGLPNLKNAKIVLSGGQGDANMVVKYGSRPSGEGQSGHKGNDQIVTFPRPKAGKYYITVYTNTGFEDARVDVSYDYSDANTELTKSMLLYNDTRVYRYRGQNITYVRRVFSLKSIDLRDFLQAEAKTKGRIYMALFKGEFKGLRYLSYRNLVSRGMNKVRVCKVTEEKYYLYSVEIIRESEDSSECSNCEEKSQNTRKFPTMYAFSGTKIQKDNGC